METPSSPGSERAGDPDRTPPQPARLGRATPPRTLGPAAPAADAPPRAHAPPAAKPVSQAGAAGRPGTPPATGQGGRRVGQLPDHRGRRRTGRLHRRSRRPPHSLSGLGCPDDAPGRSRRSRGARHLGVRGGHLMGAQALPRAAAARAGARRPRPRRRTTRRHRPGSRSPSPPYRPDPRRPAGSQVTAAPTAHSRPGGPGTPWRAADARRSLTLGRGERRRGRRGWSGWAVAAAAFVARWVRGRC